MTHTEERKMLGEKIILLQGLMNHPGWRLLEEQMAMVEQAYYAQAVAADDPTVQSKRLGAHAAIIQMRSWPKREVEATQRALIDPVEEQFLRND